MSSEWIGGIVSAPEALSEEGIGSLAVAVWLDPATDAALGMEMGLAADAAQLLASALRESLAENDEAPEVLRIADAAWADALREAAGPDAEIRIAPTPELEGIDEQLAAVLAGVQEATREPSFTEGGAIAPETIGRFFEATKRLVAGDVWMKLTDEAPVAVDVPELGVSGACLLFADSSPGFSLYETFEDYLAAEEAVDEGREPEVPLLHLGFERKADLGAVMRAEMDENGWTPGLHGAVPVLVAIGADGLARPLEARDVRLAAACAEAAAELVEAGIPEDEEQIRHAASPAGLPAVELTLPHPEYQSPEDELLEAFLEEEEGRGTDPVVAEEALVAALEFKGAADEDASIWTAAEVEEFLLLYVPRNVALQPGDLAQLPSLFGRMLRLIGTRYGAMDEKRVGRLLDQVDELLSRYRLAIADPSRWSAEKATMLRALELGIDPTDAEALERIAAEVTARPAVRQEPKVGRNDPCPCGSGKKFKKCCG